jgi:hypothetical protein
MAANTTTIQPVELVSVVDARPWERGVELPVQRGVVVSLDMGWDGYVAVWFPGRGLPVIGESVHAILRSKIANPRPVSGMPKTWVMQVCRTLRALRKAPLFSLPSNVMVDGLPVQVFIDFEAAERANKAADKAHREELQAMLEAAPVRERPLVDLQRIGTGEGTIVFDPALREFLNVKRDRAGWTLAIVGKPSSIRIEPGLVEECERAWVVLRPAPAGERHLAGEAHQVDAALGLALDALTG